ncbi:hypothetical protein TNCV_3180271 [Trichonephila clavipes]|uniref:Uncharacterized protein n=1 Tax=Trichonephila clavipes TaxID=2585209 RepID=A0A8X6RD02_TRICX|nr:hypothetical protein TNCV_3180271 [Trichonephila clavipes]
MSPTVIRDRMWFQRDGGRADLELLGSPPQSPDLPSVDFFIYQTPQRTALHGYPLQLQATFTEISFAYVCQRSSRKYQDESSRIKERNLYFLPKNSMQGTPDLG